MKRLVLLAVSALLAACAAPPPLPPLQPLAPPPVSDEPCRAAYPVGDWQFVHAIEFTMADGGRGTALGITTLTRDGAIDCVLLTVEGLGLFEARQAEGGALEVRRALPPFDKPGFAIGLIDDVRTIFRAPDDVPFVQGRINGEPACRHASRDGRVTDLLPAADGCRQIRTYRHGRAERSLTVRACREVEGLRIPEHLELRGLGPSGYTLRMTLVRAERTAVSTQAADNRQ